MTARDDLDRRLSRWLEEEGAQRSPQRLVHATRERISETSQVGSIRALRLRLPTFGQRRRLLVVMAVAATALLATWLTIGGGAGSHVTTTPFSTTRFLPAIRLGLPSNWDVGLDSRGEFDLRWSGGGTFRYPDGTTFRDGISIFRRPVAESNLTATALPGIGKNAAALANWLDGHAGLDASGLTQVTIGAAPAYRILVALPASPGLPDHCTADHPGVTACSSLFISDDRLGQYGFGIVGPETALVYLIDAPSGDTVMVVIDDVDGVERDALIAASTPIVESLEFVR